MYYHIKVTNHNMVILDEPKAYTGNTNYYQCLFDFSEEWKGLECFAVFSKEGIPNTAVAIIENKCYIPHSFFEDVGKIIIGVYGVFAGEEVKRVSAKTAEIEVYIGSYRKDTMTPAVPEKDIWETYLDKVAITVGKGVPYIGENKNWYVWDVTQQQYVDTQRQSYGEKGERGEMPQITINTQKHWVIDGHDTGVLAIDHTHPNIEALNQISMEEIINWNKKQDGFSVAAGLELVDHVLSVRSWATLLDVTLEEAVQYIELSSAAYNFKDLTRITVFVNSGEADGKYAGYVMINNRIVAYWINLISDRITCATARIFRDNAWWGITASAQNTNSVVSPSIMSNQDIPTSEINTIRIQTTGAFPIGTKIVVMGA